MTEKLAFSDPLAITKFDVTPAFKRIVLGMPEFAELAEQAERLNRSPEIEKSVRPTIDAYAARWAAGEPMRDLASAYVRELQAHEDTAGVADAIIRQARNTHDAELMQFFYTQQRAIRAAYARRLNVIKDRAAELLDELDGITTAEEVVQAPELAPAFKEYGQLEQEFEQYVRSARHFQDIHFGNGTSAKFQHALIVPALEDAWPTFHYALEGPPVDGVTTEPHNSPWPDPTALLRATAGLNFEYVVRSENEYRDELSRLNSLARRRFEQEDKIRRKGNGASIRYVAGQPDPIVN